MLLTDLDRQRLRASLRHPQKRQLYTQPLDETKPLNFFGATTMPAVIL